MKNMEERNLFGNQKEVVRLCADNEMWSNCKLCLCVCVSFELNWKKHWWSSRTDVGNGCFHKSCMFNNGNVPSLLIWWPMCINRKSQFTFLQNKRGTLTIWMRSEDLKGGDIIYQPSDFRKNIENSNYPIIAEVWRLWMKYTFYVNIFIVPNFYTPTPALGLE